MKCAEGTGISFYLDTSLVVSTLTEDVFTIPARAWLAEQPSAELRVSAWLVVEVHSALADKLRRRVIERGERDKAVDVFERLMIAADLMVLSENHFLRAAALCDRHALGLRAPDALHLAACEAGEHVLCTYDKVLAAAARAIGVAVEQP